MKNGILKGKGLDLGVEPPCINIFLSTSPGIINRYVKARGFLRFVNEVLD